MIIEYRFKEIIKIDAIEKIMHLINNMELNFPKLINRLSKEEIEIICDVFYEELSKKEKLDNYYECIDKLVINSLYSSLEENIRFDFECLKLNKMTLLKYFNYIEIRNIMKIIEERIKQKRKCKIIKFEVR